LIRGRGTASSPSGRPGKRSGNSPFGLAQSLVSRPVKGSVKAEAGEKKEKEEGKAKKKA